MKYIVFAIIIVFSAQFAHSQQERSEIREGNKAYKNSQYGNSVVSYQKALKTKKESFEAGFNLGDALYKQKKYDDAIKQYQGLKMDKLPKEDRAKVHHNIGNSYFQQNKFDESINSYKDALRLNPNDEETRYNLAYAQKKLIQQQNQQKQKDKDKKDDKKKDDKKDQKKDEKKDEKKDDKQDQKQQKQQQKISPEDAKRMLESIQNDEKNVQEKLKKEKAKTQQIKVEKDW